MASKIPNVSSWKNSEMTRYYAAIGDDAQNRPWKAVTVIVLIATSGARNELLFRRALPSVFAQTHCPDAIVVVDDNDDLNVALDLSQEITLLARRHSELIYLHNKRTRHMSGTGAWNTGIDYIAGKFGDDCYVAILDDDDEWLPNHLAVCISYIVQGNNQNNSEAVFPFLRRDDCVAASRFSTGEMNVDSFLIGNPGVQGSNMFFRVGALRIIDGFDETLASCTDRDLMIRFLGKYGRHSVKIAPVVTVLHHSGNNTVTANKSAKTMGLDKFYRKHIGKFTQTALTASLSRAKMLFDYPNEELIQELFRETMIMRKKQKIVIGVMVHDDSSTIRRCIQSIFNQRSLVRSLHVVIQDDDSHDDWQTKILDWRDSERLTIVHCKIGNVAQARTEINRYIVESFDNVALVGRLDADDEYASETALAEIERRFDIVDGADVILGGNFLRRGKLGPKLNRVNIACRSLLMRQCLLNRLQEMSQGIEEAELPSCNLFLSPNAIRPYPDFPSAEDHALLVHYLLRPNRYKIAIAEGCMPIVYSLGGSVTTHNRKSKDYINSRIKLYEEALQHDGQ